MPEWSVALASPGSEGRGPPSSLNEAAFLLLRCPPTLLNASANNSSNASSSSNATDGAVQGSASRTQVAASSGQPAWAMVAVATLGALAVLIALMALSVLLRGLLLRRRQRAAMVAVLRGGAGSGGVAATSGLLAALEAGHARGLRELREELHAPAAGAAPGAAALPVGTQSGRERRRGGGEGRSGGRGPPVKLPIVVVQPDASVGVAVKEEGASRRAGLLQGQVAGQEQQQRQAGQQQEAEQQGEQQGQQVGQASTPLPAAGTSAQEDAGSTASSTIPWQQPLPSLPAGSSAVGPRNRGAAAASAGAVGRLGPHPPVGEERWGPELVDPEMLEAAASAAQDFHLALMYGGSMGGETRWMGVGRGSG